MKNQIEKKLYNLPKVKLSRIADLKLRWRLYAMIWQKSFKRRTASLELRRLSFSLTAVLVFLCLVVVMPGYAYASPEVTRGHFLYPVKKIIESAELKIKNSPIAEINTLEKFASRRFAETIVLNQKQKDNGKKEAEVQNSIREALELTAEASRRAENISNQADQTKAEIIINESGIKHQSQLNDLASCIGFNAGEEMLDSIALAFEEIKRVVKKPMEKKIDEEINLKSLDIINNKAATSTATTSDAVVKEKPIERLNKKNNQPDQPGMNAGIFGTSTEDKRNNSENEIKKKLNIWPESEQIKNKIESLTENLKIENYNPGEIKALADNLDNKIKKAEKARDEGRLNEVGDILKKIEALSNNAEFFLKKNPENNKNINIDNKKKNSSARNFEKKDGDNNRNDGK